MPLSLTQIRNLIRSATGQDTTTLPDSEALATTPGISCDTFMNRAYWKMLNRLELRELELSTTETLSAGSVTFTMPNGISADALRMVSLNDPNDLQQYKLKQETLKWYRETYNSNTGMQERPEFYVPDGTGPTAYIWPVPDIDYTLTLDYLPILTDASLNGSIGTPRETGEIVLNGAIARVFAELNGNPAKAQFYFNMESKYWNDYVPQKAKSEMDYSTAGLDFRGREY